VHAFHIARRGDIGKELLRLRDIERHVLGEQGMGKMLVGKLAGIALHRPDGDGSEQFGEPEDGQENAETEEQPRSYL